MNEDPFKNQKSQPSSPDDKPKEKVFDKASFDAFQMAALELTSEHQYESDRLEMTNEEREAKFEILKANSHVLKDALRQRLYPTPYRTLHRLDVLAHILSADENEKYDKKFIRFVLETIEDLQPDIEYAVKNHLVQESEALRVYSDLIKYGNPQQVSVGVESLLNNLDLIEKNIKDEQLCSSNLKYLRNIISRGNFEQSKLALQAVLNAINVVKYGELFSSLVSFLFENEYTKKYGGEEIARSFLKERGLPSEEVLQDWARSNSGENLRKQSFTVYSNLKCIAEIEEKKPGAAKFLFEQFGISDFGRYPSDLLIRQVDEFESKKNPYGVIIFPKNDWNGAFYSSKVALEDLYKQTKGVFSLRVFECNSKIDLARALIKLDRLYNSADGSGHKISLLILGGHGSKDAIQFGENDEKHLLRTEDLLGKGAKRTSQFFDDHPTIILSSCSTGTEGGIGQKLSEMLGAKVVAPEVPMGLVSIHASIKSGRKFRFNAQYNGKDESKKVYTSGNNEK